MARLCSVVLCTGFVVISVLSCATVLGKTEPGRTQPPLSSSAWEHSSLYSFHVPQTFSYVAAALWLLPFVKQNAACEIHLRRPVAGGIAFLLGIHAPAFGVAMWTHLPQQQRQVYCGVWCKMSILKQTGSFFSWCLPSATKRHLWSGQRRKVVMMRRMNWTSLGAVTASGATTVAWAAAAPPVWMTLVMKRWQSGKLESFQLLLHTSHPQAGSQRTVAPNQVLHCLPALPEAWLWWKEQGLGEVKGV